MKGKILRLSATFMISLIIMLPIYSASVFARFNMVNVEGQDGIPGYIREDDYLDMTVDAYVEEDTDVTPGQVRFVTGRSNFSRCIGPNIDESFTCVLRHPPSDTMHFSLNEFPVTIQLYDDYGDIIDSYFKMVVVDREEPVVTVFYVTPKSTSNEDITFHYTAEDYAYRAGDTSKCTGILNIQLYTFGGSLIEKIDADGKCVFSGSVVIDNSKFSEGVNVVYAKAVDRFRHESTPIYTSITIDRTPVTISREVDVVDEYGNGIVYIGKDGAMADISVEIIGSDLEKEQVYGDFSELNIDIEEYIEEASCDDTLSNVTICTWPDIEIALDSTGSKGIKVTASDKAGNVKVATLTYNFIFDDEGPTVTEIKTDNVRGTKNYARASGNNFIATLVETGIGIDPLDIRLHLGRWSAGTLINQPGFPLPADECTTGWTCYWKNVDLSSEGEFTAHIGGDSVDKLGNPAQEFSADVIADFLEPYLIEMNITPIGGALPAFADYIKTYDSLQITVIVGEENIMAEAYADLSAIVDGTEKVLADDCQEENGIYTCTWQTSPIDIESYITDELKFYFTDQAGNVLEIEEPIEVYEVTDLTLDFWLHKVSCTPPAIDRQTTALINHRVYCHINLLSKEAEILSTSLAGCEGGAMEILEEDPVLFNDQAGSTDPYIKLVLRAEEMNYESIDLKCGLNIISKVGKQIGRYPELEEVDISIEFYNMPLGTYGEGVAELIEQSKDFAWYIDDWVGDLNKIMHYGQKLCGILGTLMTVFNTLAAIGSLLSGAEVAAPEPHSVMISKARMDIQNAQQGLSYAAKKGWKSLLKFCKMFSCRLFYDEIFEVKEGEKMEDKHPVAFKIGKWQKDVLKKADWVAKGGIEKEGLQVWGNTASGYETVFKGGKLSPKESIVISTLTLCIPGIVHNLNKLRQIQCMYVGCLQTNAVQGLPLRACEMQKHYATCKYWWGELFQLLPFTGLINYILGSVKQILSNPFGIVDTVLAYVCVKFVPIYRGGAAANLCMIHDLAGLATSIYSDLEGMKESWEIGNDYCDNIK